VLFAETRPGRKLRHGSKVVVLIPEEHHKRLVGPTSGELSVLYEDDCIVVVDKPPMVAVHPSGRHLSDTLIQRVHARYGAGFELEKGGAPRLCHRLDRETSGIVVCALNPIAHADVQQQFERREVEKYYLAIVSGVPREDRGSITYPIANSRMSRIELKMAVVSDGMPSRTDWEVVARYQDCALVRCTLFTGRQHQIRVHMEAIGHPVVGDKLYGGDDDLFEASLARDLTPEELVRLGMNRQALHHHRVAFRTPASGQWIEVESPLAPDMQAYLDGVA
jgi:23S rRNA pseudouridine1911/1915/1917 synthase